MAAPAVAGMAAMVLEQLPDWQGCRQSEWMRAILKASAIDHNEFFVPYWDTAFNNWGSEQGPRFARHDLAFGGDFENEDDAFGAGMPRFQRMLGWCCGAEDNWVESGDLELLPYDNLPPLNRIHPVLGMDHPNTGGESQLEQGFVYISSETEQPGRSGDSCSNDSLSFCDVPRGESDVQLRRVVVEWSECPDEMPSDPNQTPDSRIPLATDFNVSLTTPSGDTYWMSTSFDDTTEIFEFCAEEPGDYTIQVIPTQLGFGCARTPGDPNQTGEWLYVIESRTRDIDPELACPPLQHYGVGLN